MSNFINDRHQAFADVLYNDSTDELKKYCRQYGIPMTGDKKIQMVGVLKAIQECNDFTKEEKAYAATKCIDLGFYPYIHFDEKEESDDRD